MEALPDGREAAPGLRAVLFPVLGDAVAEEDEAGVACAQFRAFGVMARLPPGELEATAVLAAQARCRRARPGRRRPEVSVVLVAPSCCSVSVA